jgi:hypothetical protein
MKVDGVCKTIYSTSRDEELSINGTLEPGGTIVLKKTYMTENWAHFNI